MSDKDVWQVVEACGFTNERVISEWDTFDDACIAVKELYTIGEEVELNVSILKNGSAEY